jgi:hypothetical protein
MSALGYRQLWCKGCLQVSVVFVRTANIAHQPAELRLQSLQSPIGMFELLGMRLALVAYQHDLADAREGLAQTDAVLLRRGPDAHGLRKII